jgi:hypothetical protein
LAGVEFRNRLQASFEGLTLQLGGLGAIRQALAPHRFIDLDVKAYHLLHPIICFTLSSASPFHAANAYNHTCLGLHREKQTKPGKLKNNSSKTPQEKIVERMLGFDPKDVFFVFPRFCCFYFWVLKWTKQKNFGFLVFEWI